MRVPNSLLRELIEVEAYGGSGAHGPRYEGAVVVRASMQSTDTLRATDRDQSVFASRVLMIVRPEDGPIAPGSRVTWMDLKYRVLECYAQPDTRRPTHWQLTLTRLEA